jgi:hypothetical protein
MRPRQRTTATPAGDKTSRLDPSITGGGEIRKGLDEIVAIVPPVDQMTPQEAVTAAEPKDTE